MIFPGATRHDVMGSNSEVNPEVENGLMMGLKESTTGPGITHTVEEHSSLP
ncbi:Uncharacterized protein DAT39_007745 [Clarias magur]|uniref:Uncharacterized protein n=1 Tax=Clarias magur TaxID=1594786 RepID=A0A8J4TQP9_CLAMG|nr:Uncharacterized protein DAT39_007745 [Clarias magur]